MGWYIYEKTLLNMLKLTSSYSLPRDKGLCKLPLVHRNQEFLLFSTRFLVDMSIGM